MGDSAVEFRLNNFCRHALPRGIKSVLSGTLIYIYHGSPPCMFRLTFIQICSPVHSLKLNYHKYSRLKYNSPFISYLILFTEISDTVHNYLEWQR